MGRTVTRPARPFKASPRNPLTGRKMVIRARTQRELEAALHHVDSMRVELRIGSISRDQAERILRRLVHGPISLERAAIAYARRPGLAPETARRVVRSWLPGAARELAPLELEALDAPRLKRWIDELAGEGHAPGGISTAWSILRSVGRYAVERGWIARYPWGEWRPMIAGKRKRKEREAARSPDELARVLEAARAADARALAASRRALGDLEARIATMALCGVRQGELAGLRWRDVDEAAGTVTIARQWDTRRAPKGRSIATLRALPELFALLSQTRRRLEDLGALRPGGDGPCFPDVRAWRDASRYCHQARARSPEPLPSSALRSCVLRAGLPRPSAWTATSLRDTFATLEAAAFGEDLDGLRTRTRHASIGSLLRYLRARSRALAAPGFCLPERPMVAQLSQGQTTDETEKGATAQKL